MRVAVCIRYQVNYSIIAVDILLFVAVVDRRPAVESGSLSTLFALRILAISRALFLTGFDSRRGRDVISAVRIARFAISLDRRLAQLIVIAQPFKIYLLNYIIMNIIKQLSNTIANNRAFLNVFLRIYTHCKRVK